MKNLFKLYLGDDVKVPPPPPPDPPDPPRK